MPWSEKSIMSQRHEFVMLFEQDGVNRRELCRRFGDGWLPVVGALSPGRQDGLGGSLAAAAALAGTQLGGDGGGGAGGARRASGLGRAQDLAPAAGSEAPAGAERRHDHRDPASPWPHRGVSASAGHKAFERFERAAPNELWQMDYKGHFATRAGRCHPLTVVDDHSRYAVGLRACGDERGDTVQAELTAIFRRYGLPERMLMDNGAPWGSDALHRHTWLTVWLLELGVAVSHGRPYHPQTQGKDERFHRTLTAEVIGRRAFADLAECQGRFDAWRVVYNTQRPHEALALATPAARYRPSKRRLSGDDRAV